MSNNTQEVNMYNRKSASRLMEKSTLHTIQVELQQGYNLSPVEAQVLAHRVQQLVDEQSGFARQLGQVTYRAIALDEPPGKPLRQCRKVPVHLSLIAEGDAQVWATEGPGPLRRLRVHRLVYEALLQGGALSQEDLACLLGVSLKTIKRDFAFYREPFFLRVRDHYTESPTIPPQLWLAVPAIIPVAIPQCVSRGSS